MPAREEYRKKAQAILAQAEMIRDPQERAALLTIARTYLKLSDRIGERHQRGTAHRRQADDYPQNDS